MAAIAHNLERAYPDTNQGITAVVRSLGDEINDDDVPVLVVLD